MGSLTELQRLCNGKSIAIVGNAQSLLSMNLAHEIDSHDVVVRINKSVMSDYTIRSKIGSKCDLYTASGVGMLPVELHTMTKPKLCYYMTTRLREIVPEEFHFFPEDMWKELQKELGKGNSDIRPSTGIMTLYMIAYGTEFKNINMYGFDFWNTKTFYNPTIWVARTHKPDYEKEFVNTLLSKHDNIKLIGV